METDVFSNQARGQINEFNILKTLAKVGWARTEDLCAWGYPVQPEITRRTLVKLFERNLLSRHPLPCRFGTAYRLTKAGIKACRMEGIRVSWAEHIPPAIGPRFHEQLIAMHVLGALGGHTIRSYFARDIHWAPNSTKENTPIKQLPCGYEFPIPYKQVDALALVEVISPADEVEVAPYMIEIEWARKTGKPLERQMESMEEVLTANPYAHFVHAYPASAAWQRDALFRMGKTPETINHHARLLTAMRKRPSMIKLADRIIFMACNIAGNFHFGQPDLIYPLAPDLAGHDEFIRLIPGDWIEEEAYFDENEEITHAKYIHQPTQAYIVLWRDRSPLGRGWRWHAQRSCDLEGLHGLERIQANEMPLNKVGLGPLDSWDDVVTKLQASLLSDVFLKSRARE